MSQPFPSTQSNFTVPSTLVPVSGVSGVLLPADTSRGQFSIQTPVACPGVVYVKFGLGASLVDYKFFLDPGDYYESEKGEYCGDVTAILSVAGPTSINVTDQK